MNELVRKLFNGVDTSMLWKLTALHVLIIAVSNALVNIPVEIFGFKLTWAAFTFPLVVVATVAKSTDNVPVDVIVPPVRPVPVATEVTPDDVTYPALPVAAVIRPKLSNVIAETPPVSAAPVTTVGCEIINVLLVVLAMTLITLPAEMVKVPALEVVVSDTEPLEIVG